MKNTFMFVIIALLLLVITGCTDEKPLKEEADWKESPLFQSDGYTMIGNEGHLGFIYDNTEAVRFYPNKVQKYMWHFWGNEDELIGDFEVLATHESSDEAITIVRKSAISTTSPNNGADHHIPTTMMLPESGMWKLDAYMGGKLFGTVYVKVH